MKISKFVTAVVVFVLAAMVLAACAPPEPEIREVVVTKEVQVEVEVPVVQEVTPEPIGGELILYACLFDPDKLEVIFQTFKAQYGVDVTCLDMSSGCLHLFS